MGAAGLVFFLAGLAILTGPRPGTPEAARSTWQGLLLGLGGSVSIPFVSVSGPSSEWSGRVAFGAVAVLVDAFALWVIVRGLRDLLGRGR